MTQLGEVAQQSGLSERRIRIRDEIDHVAAHDSVHQSLLAYLLSHIGLYSPAPATIRARAAPDSRCFPALDSSRRTTPW
ncbi:hypothetical protein [Nesterenkonia pannonica]|uniref:hypothetical protein n=1 Tax=Nesterenkonia pannonica TaxID=1548602 RepID=UPI0021646CEF|nr:hypothetical protein [Nesterenkonia pannonica]